MIEQYLDELTDVELRQELQETEPDYRDALAQAEKTGEPLSNSWTGTPERIREIKTELEYRGVPV